MPKRLIVLLGVSLVVLTFSSGIRGQNQPWNNSGLAQSRNEPHGHRIGTAPDDP